MTGSDQVLQRLTALHPKLIDLSLDRMQRLLDALGNPERRLPQVVHIAGTNGKGSTLAMIRAGLESRGHRVHAYTSPHLARFHERIRVAGELIDEPALEALLEEVETVNAGAPITFFEVTTAAAILAFSRCDADFTLLEVGLGGRLDATNVVERPRLCVITPVSVDHTQFLGNTIDLIASEKAGILKRRVRCVVAPQQPEALAVIEARATRLAAPLSVGGRDWTMARDGDRLVFQDDRGLLDLPLPVLRGPFQIVNAGTAVAALRALGEGEAAAEKALTGAVWPARMQRLAEGPLVAAAGRNELWLDGGHNPSGGQAVADSLAALPRRPTHLVCGMLNSKDIEGYLAPLAQSAESLIAVTIPDEPNALPAAEIAAAARSAGLPAEVEPSVSAAVARLAVNHPGTRVLICGSLYLAGQVLRNNG